MAFCTALVGAAGCSASISAVHVTAGDFQTRSMPEAPTASPSATIIRSPLPRKLFCDLRMSKRIDDQQSVADARVLQLTSIEVVVGI